MKKEREINIFSISFIDVFCCALGAMILIFVLNSSMLSNIIKDAVQKYRQKTEEAKKERALAVKSRNAARISRDEAIKAKAQALQSRNDAEKAEQEALESKKLAIIARDEAQKSRIAAMEAERKSKKTTQRLNTTLEKAKQMYIAQREANKILKKRNKDLEDINQTLRDLIKSNKMQDKKLRVILTKYKKLQKNYAILRKNKNALKEKIIILNSDKTKLTEEQKLLEKWYKEAKRKNTLLRGRYEKLINRNNNLSSRLGSKSNQLRSRERIIAQKEREIRNREIEITIKEKQIIRLRKLLEKKADKSLFGIKLKYQRIVFLFDRSGSIIQNNWKSVIINTCKEILSQCEVDEFAIIAFSSRMAFFPQRRGVMAAGGKRNNTRAINWLKNSVRFGGSTHLHQALEIAYEEYGNLDAIFLITDGLPSAVGRSSTSLQKQIIRYIKAKVRKNITTKIITIAIGYPPANAKEYADIYKYLHQISELTGGQYLGR